MRLGTKNARYFALLFALFGLLAAFAPKIEAQQTQTNLSRAQLKELIANAKEPADHQKLAAYYRGKAQQAKAAIAEHQDMLAAYEKNPSTHALAKAQGGPRAMCNDLIRIYGQEEKTDLELAAYHERMAQEAAKP